MNDTRVKIVDLGEAAALLTLGFDLVSLDELTGGIQRHRDGRPVPPPKVFVFAENHPNTPEVTIKETLDFYQRRKLQVDAFSYYRSQKELKNKIHDCNAGRP